MRLTIPMPRKFSLIGSRASSVVGVWVLFVTTGLVRVIVNAADDYIMIIWMPMMR
jgi:hypothetical protein